MGKGIVDKLKGEFDIEDEWLPLEIHPETPKEGELISKRFPSSSIDKMYDNLRVMGRPYGIDFKSNEILSNSYLALSAGEFAKEKGKFEEFNEKIFHAYFSEGKDIGNIDVLINIGKSLGLDENEMVKKLRDNSYDNVLKDTQRIAHEYDIRSTPTFIIDDKYTIVGAQPIEAFREVILKLE